jgi:hypothetical protein
MRGVRLLRAVAGTAGAAALGYGCYGLLTDRFVQDPAAVGRWAAGAVLLHDGVWAPVLLATGPAVGRLGPEWVRGPVRTGLLVAAAVTVVALPVLVRRDAHHGNSSLLPLDYPRGWLLCLAAVAVATGAAVLLRGVVRHRARARAQVGSGRRDGGRAAPSCCPAPRGQRCPGVAGPDVGGYPHPALAAPSGRHQSSSAGRSCWRSPPVSKKASR